MSDQGSVAPKEQLHGDDLSFEEIAKWYEEEAAFHDQFEGGRRAEHWRIYEVFDQRYVFGRYFHAGPASKVLSFGCAEGADLEKTWQRLGFQLYGIEASTTFIEAFESRFPDAEIRRATISGDIEYPDGHFDYVVGLGVLHHIPNVSHIIAEFHRVLRPGGTLIVREPISRMRAGELDRPGLSPNERGIPITWMAARLRESGFDVHAVRPSYSAPLMRLLKVIPRLQRYEGILWQADRWLCRLPGAARYQRDRLWQKMAAGAAYFVAVKPDA